MTLGWAEPRSHSSKRAKASGIVAVLLLLLALAVVASGCFSGGGSDRDPPPPGSLQVRWRITALSKSCEEVGVATVLVEASFAGEVAASELASCEDRVAELRDLSPGIYGLTLTGLDAERNPIYRARLGSVRVESEELTPAGLLELELMPASLEVAWSFANGMLCAPNDVRQIRLTLFDVDPVEVVWGPADYPCDYAEGWVLIDDIPPGEVEVVASALSEDEEPLFFATQRLELTAQQHERFNLQLQFCEPGVDQPGC